jgi:hypothetical protein
MNPIKLVNPINMTRCAFGLVGTAVGLADTVGRSTVHVLLTGLHDLKEAADQGTGAGRKATAGGTAVVDDAPVPGQTTAAAAAAAVTDLDGAPPGPTVVPAEPHAPQEPPIDVVGEALAAEAAAEPTEASDGVGLAHEPRGASRDEEHGDAPLQRAEADEISEEAAAALEGDVEPEAHLTAPLLDPADTKALEAEMQTMSKAADQDKG